LYLSDLQKWNFSEKIGISKNIDAIFYPVLAKIITGDRTYFQALAKNGP